MKNVKDMTREERKNYDDETNFIIQQTLIDYTTSISIPLCEYLDIKHIEEFKKNMKFISNKNK